MISERSFDFGNLVTLETYYPESEYSRQRGDAALKLGGREERGKERIL